LIGVLKNSGRNGAKSVGISKPSLLSIIRAAWQYRRIAPLNSGPVAIAVQVSDIHTGMLGIQ
jgi:hypothetical protein